MDNNPHSEIVCCVFCIRYSFWLVLLYKSKKNYEKIYLCNQQSKITQSTV